MSVFGDKSLKTNVFIHIVHVHGHIRVFSKGVRRAHMHLLYMCID